VAWRTSSRQSACTGIVPGAGGNSPPRFVSSAVPPAIRQGASRRACLRGYKAIDTSTPVLVLEARYGGLGVALDALI